MSALIEAVDLRKSFSGTAAVDGVCLNIEAGQIYGLVGSDGAGKTTTLRMLVGALKPDSGRASICGYALVNQGEQARARLGYLSQRFSLYEDLTVLENIRFFAELRGLGREEWQPRCRQILEFVGLAAFQARRAGQLSGGMKQKLGLATALVTGPQVLLLDEPTTGVDPVTRQDFWQLVIRIAASQPGGMAVLLTTPYMDEAARCTRVGFMRAGRVSLEGSPVELRRRLEGRILEARGGSLRALRERARSLRGVEDVRAFGDRLHLRVAEGQAQAVQSALGRGTAHPIAATLEDVFIALASPSLPGSEP